MTDSSRLGSAWSPHLARFRGIGQLVVPCRLPATAHEDCPKSQVLFILILHPFKVDFAVLGIASLTRGEVLDYRICNLAALRFRSAFITCNKEGIIKDLSCLSRSARMRPQLRVNSARTM